MKIFGFSLLRNGIKYDFPFAESLRSLAPPVEEIYLALAESEDGTESAVDKLPKLKIIPTVWDDGQKGEGGLILSQQTNIALDAIRKDHKGKDVWAIYLQADEVLLESEYDHLVEDIKKANKGGYDAISLRYIHFWQRPDQFAFRKRWYPQEIRVVRVNTKIESWGDAQSFRNCRKIYQSNVPIFHYGHVREPSAYEQKTLDIMDWWHSADEIPRLRKRNKRRDLFERTLPYLGPHPAVMQDRVNHFFQTYGRSAEILEKNEATVFLVDRKKELSQRFLEGIRAGKCELVSSLFDVRMGNWPLSCATHPSIMNQWFAGNKVPYKMQSERALPWTPEFYVATQLWSKGVSTEFLS